MYDNNDNRDSKRNFNDRDNDRRDSGEGIYNDRDDDKRGGQRDFKGNGRDNDNRDNDIIFGVRSVIEAIKAGKEINKIMIQRGMNKELFKELKEELANQTYNLQFVPIQKLNRLTRKNHQGVIAFIAPIAYQEIEPIITKLFEEGEVPNIMILAKYKPFTKSQHFAQSGIL